LDGSLPRRCDWANSASTASSPVRGAKLLDANDGTPARLSSARSALPAGVITSASFDPTTRKFRQAGQVGTDLGFSTALRLRDGSVLIAGGYSSVCENPVRRAWTFEVRPL
jgi:hypothetical protein